MGHSPTQVPGVCPIRPVRISLTYLYLLCSMSILTLGDDSSLIMEFRRGGFRGGRRYHSYIDRHGGGGRSWRKRSRSSSRSISPIRNRKKSKSRSKSRSRSPRRRHVSISSKDNGNNGHRSGGGRRRSNERRRRSRSRSSSRSPTRRRNRSPVQASTTSSSREVRHAPEVREIGESRGRKRSSSSASPSPPPRDRKKRDSRYTPSPERGVVVPVDNAGDRRGGSRWERERKSSEADEVTRSSRSSSNIQLGDEIVIEGVNASGSSRGREHTSGGEMNRRQKNSSSPSSSRSGASTTDE